MELQTGSLLMCLQSAFSTWGKLKASLWSFLLKWKKALSLEKCFNSMPMVWDAMLVCVLHGLCKCVGPLSNRSASPHSAATFAPLAVQHAMLKLKPPSLPFSSKITVSGFYFFLIFLTACSPVLPSLFTGDKEEVCFNYQITFHTSG